MPIRPISDGWWYAPSIARSLSLFYVGNRKKTGPRRFVTYRTSINRRHYQVTSPLLGSRFLPLVRNFHKIYLLISHGRKKKIYIYINEYPFIHICLPVAREPRGLPWASVPRQTERSTALVHLVGYSRIRPQRPTEPYCRLLLSSSALLPWSRVVI